MSSGFVTETEIAEARKRRQEEWEKVRQPDQPIERPEEPYDGRSLYDRLQEQKMKKDLEYEETHKLKNLIRGLDDEEVQFLDLVDQTKMSSERKQLKEDEQELEDFRNRVSSLQEESVDKKIQTEIKQPKAKIAVGSTASRLSQKSLLTGIKRKCNDMNEAPAAQKPIPSENGHQSAVGNKPLDVIRTTQFDRGALKCVAILPGIGPYTESSDSEMSTGSEEEPEQHSKYNLLGLKNKKKKQCQQGE